MLYAKYAVYPIPTSSRILPKNGTLSREPSKEEVTIKVMSPAKAKVTTVGLSSVSSHFSVAVVNKSWAVFFKSSPANTLTDLVLELIFVDRRPATEAVRDEAAPRILLATTTFLVDAAELTPALVLTAVDIMIMVDLTRLEVVLGVALWLAL